MKLHIPDSSTLTYDKCTFCYGSEARRFAEIYVTPTLYPLIKYYIKDKDIIKKNKAKHSRQTKTTKKTCSTISLSEYDPFIWEAVAKAQIAVHCHLFNGLSIDSSNITPDVMEKWGHESLNKIITKHGKLAYTLILRNLQIADSIRCIQIVRELGLFHGTADATYQLSLGASSGERDLNAIHTECHIELTKNYTNTSHDKSIHFESRPTHSKHTVLLDADKTLQPCYRRLNLEGTGNTAHGNAYAMIGDANKTLLSVRDMIDNGLIKKRNLVTAFRIDHRMIPDVEKFFQSIVQTTTDMCNLILTIGAGDDIEQFTGRKVKVDEIFDFLSSRGMNPTRILMRKSDDTPLDSQRASPLFGIPEYTSYEILFCRLKKKLLQN